MYLIAMFTIFIRNEIQGEIVSVNAVLLICCLITLFQQKMGGLFLVVLGL